MNLYYDVLRHTGFEHDLLNRPLLDSFWNQKLKLGPVCQDLGKSWTRSQRRNRKAGYEHSIWFVRVDVYF